MTYPEAQNYDPNLSKSMTMIAFESCPACPATERKTMVADWQQLVDEGAAIDIVGCGNPWHYTNMEREEQDDAPAADASADSDAGAHAPV